MAWPSGSKEKAIALGKAPRYAHGMTAEEVKGWPLSQKIQVMEALWEDLRDRFEQSEPSQAVKHLLLERRTRVREGSAKVVDWDSVKSSIGRP
jgi:hypothetical protein